MIINGLYSLQRILQNASIRLRLRSVAWVRIAIALLLILALNTQPAWAGRAVLNQTPETVEQSFGHYWTKLTDPYKTGKKDTVIYTYSPAPLRKFFPNIPFATLSMRYVNGRVQSVLMQPYRTEQEKKNNRTGIGETDVIDRAMEAKLFEAIFGYRPPIYKPLYLLQGSVNVHTDCLGDGVATTFGTTPVFGDHEVKEISLEYNPACEPPYDRIKLTIGEDTHHS